MHPTSGVRRTQVKCDGRRVWLRSSDIDSDESHALIKNNNVNIKKHQHATTTQFIKLPPQTTTPEPIQRKCVSLGVPPHPSLYNNNNNNNNNNSSNNSHSAVLREPSTSSQPDPLSPDVRDFIRPDPNDLLADRLSLASSRSSVADNINRMPRYRRAAAQLSLASSSSAHDEMNDETVIMEKRYLLAVERGDMGSVKHFLQMVNTNTEFNINCVDPLGRSSLLIAIENENIEMIETLLENNVDTGDAILYAINEENVEAVEILLNHLERLDKFTPENQGVEINEHSAFAPDITPIILGAHRDNYEIIKLLLDRGASIPHPHDVRCACKDCIQANQEDSLRLSRSRINAYRALASPSLICLSARDPILYAFELSWELRRLSYIENENKTDYQELSHKCQQFSTAMLDQVRGSKELEIILNHDTSDKFPAIRDARNAGERMQLARLKLAIQFRQKKFVAHPNCQQLLAAIWYEGLPGFRRRHAAFKVLLTMGISFSFPILALMYLFFPKASFSGFIRKPFIKFLCHSASYCFFLFLLILASQRIDYEKIFASDKDGMPSMTTQVPPSTSTSTSSSSESQDKDPDRKERRGPPPTPVEWAIMAWVAGLIWVEVKQLWDSGLHEYAHNMWNILDFITNALYISTFALRLIAYLQVEHEMRSPKMAHIGRRLARRYWDAWDPTLISECMFATANIFSSLKLVHIFTVNPHLGPLQISLGRMVVDIMKFFAVYLLVVFAFGCGLNQLFWYYATMRLQECEWSRGNIDGMTPEVREELADSCGVRFKSFANIYKSLESMFWLSLGLQDLSALEIKEPHHVTLWAGKTMFGGYAVVAGIVLTNLLIAMMTESYSRIIVSHVAWHDLGPNNTRRLQLELTNICLFNTLETLFWAMFGLTELENFQLKEKHIITEWAGKTMFGAYSCIAIAVLLNMLIAMMSNSYELISNQADAEWKFARSKLWIEYFEEGGTLPPPFNIIPSPKSFYYVLRWFFERFCKKCARRMTQTKQRSVKLQKILKAVSQREANYQLVMRNLVKRYVAHEQREKQLAEGVSEDDVNEIKQDITGRSNKRGRTAERRIMKGYSQDVPPIPEAGAFTTAKDDARLNAKQSSSPGSSSPSPWTRIKRMSKNVKFGDMTSSVSLSKLKLVSSNTNDSDNEIDNLANNGQHSPQPPAPDSAGGPTPNLARSILSKWSTGSTRSRLQNVSSSPQFETSNLNQIEEGEVTSSTTSNHRGDDDGLHLNSTAANTRCNSHVLNIEPQLHDTLL